MANAWSPFYWGDYIADTGHLSLAEHGAYVLLMAHYYRTRRPLPANASVLHRICRCTTDADRLSAEQVLREFFVLDGDAYRHHRIDRELSKAADISEVRRAAAKSRHQKKRHGADANAPANAEQMHTQPQPQPQPQKTTTKKRCGAGAPSLDDVVAYCGERGNQVDPQQWFDHYAANGWKVGRNGMKDWRAAVRTWEKNGISNAKPSRQQRIAAAQTTSVELTPTPQPELPADLDGPKGGDAWRVIAARLKPATDPHSYSMWLQPLRGLGIARKTLFIRLPSPDFKEPIERKYGELIVGEVERMGLTGVTYIASTQSPAREWRING